MKKKPEWRSLFSTFWDAFLPENVVLVQAMGLCPILAVGFNLKNAVALAVCTAVVLLPMNLLLSLFGERLPQWLRPAVYVLITTALLLGTAAVLRQWISADIYASLYLFLPLMAVNTLFTLRPASAHAATAHPLVLLADSLGTVLGFALVLCIASALREAAMTGHIWGVPLGFEARFPEAEHPFIGYVLLGFMAAALQWVKQLLRRGAPKEKEDLL